MPQHSEELDIGLLQGRWSGRLALKHKVFPSLYLNELCICIVMGRSYFRAEEEEKMRFSDQIDPGSGALRNWQAASESLLFDQGASQAARAERRAALTCEIPLACLIELWREALRCWRCNSALEPCRTVTPYSLSNSATAAELCFQRDDIASQTLTIYMAICRWHSMFKSNTVW